MHTVPLSTASRQTNISARQLRRSGSVPCVVYGNTENTTFQCELNALMKAYTKAGESTIVELDLDGTTIPALFHDVTFDPVTDKIEHVDFFAVDMNKEVEADVALHFDGESQAVKDGAILVTTMDAVTVRCLPKNLPHHLEVDLTKLIEMGAQITVADIAAPQGVIILAEPDTVVAIAQEPREEEVEEVPVAEGAAAAAEGGAAPAEGAAPADGEAATAK